MYTKSIDEYINSLSIYGDNYDYDENRNMICSYEKCKYCAKNMLKKNERVKILITCVSKYPHNEILEDGDMKVR